MSYSNNPTAMSAVIGEEIVLSGGADRRTELLKQLIMPALLLAFAGYLAIGMLTMRVPEGTAFPGPKFFPALIASGLTLFAILLAVQAVRAHRASAALARAEALRGLEEGETGVVADQTAPGSTTATGDPAHAEPARRVGVDWRSLAWVVGSFLAFALVLPTLGWIIAAGLLFWGVARGFGAGKPLASLIVGFTLSSFVYIAFDMVLGMSLPSGILGWGF